MFTNKCIPCKEPSEMSCTFWEMTLVGPAKDLSQLALVMLTSDRQINLGLGTWRTLSGLHVRMHFETSISQELPHLPFLWPSESWRMVILSGEVSWRFTNKHLSWHMCNVAPESMTQLGAFSDEGDSPATRHKIFLCSEHSYLAWLD